MLREAIEREPENGGVLEDDVSTTRASHFEDIYRLTYQKTLAFACRRTMTMSDALDVVSETYLVAWRRLDKLLAVEDPQAWLYGIARRVLLNVNRGQRRRENLLARAEQDQADLERDPAESVAESQELMVVLAALDHLSESDQELLRLAAYEELSPTEIAVVMETRPVIVRGALYRARRRLVHAMIRPDKRRNGSSGHIHDDMSPVGDGEEPPE